MTYIPFLLNIDIFVFAATEGRNSKMVLHQTELGSRPVGKP
jgi:hypothetical protein